MSLRKFFRVGTKFFFFLFSGKTWLRTEATKVFWNIIHLKKTFFCFFFVIFSNFFFNRKKNHVWKKSTKHSEGKFLCCIFSSVKTFSPLRFRKPSVVSSFQSWKNMFFQKNPPKSSTHKTFVFHLVSRNIFHLKHFFLDFYFCFFVFFSSVKNFLPCGTKWRNSFLSTRFHPEYKENTISGENV